ncbi:MAG TPA: energy transducer TonB [Blastocatellia bacterium]|nr:energy transducer TonB [Blastocatellia bacterium]
MRLFATVAVFFVLAGTLSSQQQLEWDQYDSKEGAFSVRMPGGPVESPFEMKMDGKRLTGVKVSSKAGDYYVISVNLPKAITDDKERNKTIDNFGDEWVRMVKGQQTSKLVVYLKHTLPGKSLTIIADPNIILTDVFVLGQKIFFVVRTFLQRTDIDWWGSARFFTTFNIAGLSVPEDASKPEEPAVMPSFSRKPEVAQVSGDPVTRNEGLIRADAAFLADALYSDEAKGLGLRGKLVVDIQIDEYGVVTSAVARNGEPKLREAAEFAAHNCIFYPMKEKGIIVRVKGVLTYNFGVIQ